MCLWTRDASKLLEDTYTQAMEHACFVTGTANPCVFYHKVGDITIVAHGDDFTAHGTDNDLDWYEKHLKDHFEIQLRGRLGEGCTGSQEIMIFNRIVAVTSAGLTNEADPRHTDLLMSSLDLTPANSSSTPGVKPHDRDDLAVKVNKPDSTAHDDYSNPDATIAAICAAGPVGCEKGLEPHQKDIADGAPVHSSDEGLPPQNTFNDTWMQHGTCGVWTRQHTKFRRRLEPPCKIENGPNHPHRIASMRLTRGTYDNGQNSTIFDTWRSKSDAHRQLQRLWTGTTALFG